MQEVCTLAKIAAEKFAASFLGGVYQRLFEMEEIRTGN